MNTNLTIFVQKIKLSDSMKFYLIGYSVGVVTGMLILYFGTFGFHL